MLADQTRYDYSKLFSFKGGGGGVGVGGEGRGRRGRRRRKREKGKEEEEEGQEEAEERKRKEEKEETPSRQLAASRGPSQRGWSASQGKKKGDWWCVDETCTQGRWRQGRDQRGAGSREGDDKSPNRAAQEHSADSVEGISPLYQLGGPGSQ